MTLHTWLAFLVGVIVICGSPGPNMLKVMSSSARYGFRRAFFTMAGCFLPVFLMIGASLVGVGAFIQVFPDIFNLLRYAGAGYLIYLGVQAWCESKAVAPDIAQEEAAVKSNHLFWHGFFVGFSNPKAILFATAFFPQFLDPNAAQIPQFVIMLATFSVIEISWYLVYAFGGSRFTQAMKNPVVQKRFNRVTGGLFMFFGAALVAKS